MIARFIDHGLPSAGLYVSPAVWLLSTQLNYMLPGLTCSTGLPLVLIAGLLLALVSALSGALSWRAWSARGRPELFGQDENRPHGFLALIGTATSALFTTAILLHATANLFLTGCER